METTELNSIDRHFAALLQRFAARPSPELELAAQLVSRLQADGHVCVSLAEVTGESLRGAGITERLPHKSSWSQKLRESGVVGEANESRPLILDVAGRLYLQRYWRYERAVAENLSARLQSTAPIEQRKMSEAFAKVGSQEAKLQKLAAFVAATSRLSVISGAPGTGKTHTIILVCELVLRLSNETQIVLAAPTGKAAARLKEALAAAKSKRDLPEEIRVRLPEEASTIQRLLGVIGETGKFRHNAKNPLRADVVIVDEASMIDLALLAKLLDAVAPAARVVLVGDKDQLASVEAGSAFRDMCTPGFEVGVSETTTRAFSNCTGEKVTEAVAPLAPVHNAIVELRENFRFASGTAIADLSAAINLGDAAKVSATVKQGGAVKWRPTPGIRTFERELRERVRPHFEKLRGLKDAKEALQRLSEFTILCALRRGPFGAEAANRIIERMFFEAGDAAAAQKYFHGQPLMIVRNDYQSSLFNGDLGIVLADENGERAFFAGENGEVRRFAPARLPENETAFALTVHKSQGSEFREALVILPEQDSPVLTRELVYTAVTRVRERVEIWASESILRQAIERKIRRSSGLREALWGENSK